MGNPGLSPFLIAKRKALKQSRRSGGTVRLLHGVHPDPCEILRYAQNDRKRRAPSEWHGVVFARNVSDEAISEE